MRKAKILVVDDEPDIIEFLTHILTPEGFEVVPAYDGLSALDLAEMEAPELIILDIMMPLMSGYETAEQLKTNTLTQHIPILCLTSAHTIDARSRSRQAGADGLLEKPFAPKELIAEVRRLLEPTP